MSFSRRLADGADAATMSVIATPLPAGWERQCALHELFEEQAARSPAADAVIWEGHRLSYRELDERANRLAHLLQQRGLRPQQSVGIALPRVPDLIVAMLAILKAGASYVPLDPAYPPERLAFMVVDSACQFIIISSIVSPDLGLGSSQLVPLDRCEADLLLQPTASPAVAVCPADLAYVIYTSGSTGRPKGVAIEHRSAVVFLQWARATFSASELAGMLAATSICFDLSIFEIFAPLCWGGTALLVNNVLELTEFPLRDQVTLVNTVPSAMRELLRLQALPPSVMTVCLAGEAFPAALVRELGRLGRPIRALNLYGPTEDTTYSTWADVDLADGKPPPIGRPLPGTCAYVMDSEMALCPVGEVGELYLGGAGLARGYLGRPDLTAERFVPDRFSGDPAGRLYRTGDHVRMRPDGLLEYLGRIDDQVKIRGYRVELGEIERVLADVDGVAECIAVLATGPAGDDRLALYFTGPANIARLREAAAAALPTFMVPAAFIRVDTIPRTPNGKRDRSRLPSPDWGAAVDGAAAGQAPAEALEKSVARIWSELLGLPCIGRHQNYLALGGHSLLATRIVARVRDELKRDLSLAQFFAHPTIASLADAIARLPQLPNTDLVAAPRRGHAALSAAQRQMWFAAQVDPTETSYLVPCSIRITGRIEPALMEFALNDVVRRQSALRTSIQWRDGHLVQLIAPELAVHLSIEDTAGEAALRQQALGLAATAMDLAQAPLLRVKLLRLAPDDWCLALAVHHIVFDAWSLGLLVRQIAVAYGAAVRGVPAAAPDRPIEFADYCAWQQSRDWSEGLAFFRRQLAGAEFRLNLPTTHPRGDLAGSQGGNASFLLDHDLSDCVDALAAREQATPFMLLLAAFQTLVAALANENNFVTLTAAAGRRHRQTEDLIGCLMNMVAIRAALRPSETFLALLGRVKAAALGALEHQELPFELVIADLRPPRDPGYTPIGQVAFGVQNAPEARCELDGLSYAGTELRPDQARLDLTLWIDRSTGPLRAVWTYRASLFTEAQIASFHAMYARLLRRIVDAPDSTINTLQSGCGARSMTATTPRKSFPGRAAPSALTAGNLVRTEPNWLGTPLPTRISAQLPGLSLADWVSAHRDKVEHHLRQCGGILFRDFQVESIGDFQRFARVIASELIQYGERSSPRTELAEGIYTSTDHPADQPILLHNEQSYTLNWPMRIMFFCELPPLKHGRTPIADSRRILARLPPATVEKFERLGVRYTRNYLPGISLPWTEAFQTTDRSAVEAYCRAASLEFEWLDDGRLRTRQTRPAVRIHPVTGERTWFNHALFFHVTGLPDEISRSLRAAVADEDLPYNTYFGDGSPIEDAVLGELRMAYEAETTSFEWRQGDVLLLDNMLVAHGREPFEGPRKIRTAMTDPYEQLYGTPASHPQAPMERAS
ncbi:amino acid adenylation domain-containing protein [Bradyrhizobium elkanii]|uniref:amino acid adenylation domain-containing protein n=1 Tax=Bradyrhizobium elkanii TaxID=29448 RepID=UPI002167E390|nr:amino acid adenylation domain-containing protein [Bradyrhizobium elkanii]MCS3519238.1 amino acid adenylation domain-containing protein [Bradyrhizobium elkanii]MCS4066896.1 amino acid adenylation domain-containing protein [Bradyrhizobium elkanii]MCS4082431.1 amino acid adenylation domain-containing protein [Bradyrhizobium elkanii]MCW2127955.1 amino acid adenylation domain-containing protein [Bradyrhizobium elkanii]MCW2174696.1 amino acid adenylation domain-containing protein [Bradyrhizobium 